MGLSDTFLLGCCWGGCIAWGVYCSSSSLPLPGFARSIQTMSAPVRFVVVGCGSIGREYAMRHLILNGLTTVAAVVDLDSALASSLARDVGLRLAGADVTGLSNDSPAAHNC